MLRRLSFLSLALLCASASASTPTGAEVLQRCQRAYDSVRTLEEDVKGTIGANSGTAHISFSRPGKLRVSGQTMFRAKYDMLSDGRKTWVLNGGQWSEVQSVEMGIATITGISANAGTHVPAALMHTPWGGLINLRNGRLTVVTQMIGGRNAYRVHASSPMDMTLWIDAKTYFLIRSESKVMNSTIVVEFGAPVVNRPIPASRFTH